RTGDFETMPVELVSLDDRGLQRVDAVAGGAVGRIVVLPAEPRRGNPPERAALGQRVLPQLLGRGGVGVPTRHTDNRDGRSSAHATLPTASATGAETGPGMTAIFAGLTGTATARRD